MRIIQVVPKMDIGGVERGVIDQVRHFKDKDTENIVISGGGRMVSDLRSAGALHYELPVYRKSLFSFFLVRPLRKMINDRRADIVHARSRVPGWISFFATRGTDAHFIATAHGMYKSKFMSQVMGWGKFVICPSTVIARHMKSVFGVPEERIVIINRWVDSGVFKFKDYSQRQDSNTIVSVGRISSSKGFEYLIAAFKRVVRNNPYIKLKIIGSADKSKEHYLESLKTLVGRYSLSYNVEFCGFRPDIENVLAEARMLISPSVIDESFGRTIVEAFSCGVPVIATSVGAHKEIIRNRQNGLLVEPRNSEELANSILELLKDKKLAQDLTETARGDIGKYSMANSLDEVMGVYKKAMSFLRILVIKISSFGDLILAMPSLKAIKEKFPESKLCLLTLKKYASFLHGCPYVDEVITVNDDYKRFRNTISVAKTLRMRAFDYIIDLQNSKTSHLLSFLSFARYSFGYSLRRGFMLNRRVKYNYSDDPLTSQERVLKLLGITLREKKLCLWDGDEQTRFSLPKNDLIGINISASKNWESKNWPTENIISLIETIYKNFSSVRIVLLGDQNSKDRADKIENLLWPRPINLCGKTSLRDLAPLMKKLKVFIAPDTALLHLASAAGIPTIALFGPTDPSRHTVRANNLHVFLKKINCSFCYKPKCMQTEKNICLKKISPQEVFLKIKDILGK